MTRLKSTLIKSSFVAAVAAGSIAAISTPASAEVVCNRYHECWHVADHVVYPPDAHIFYHPDAWRRAHTSHYRWRADHEEHGYYRNGVGIKF